MILEVFSNLDNSMILWFYEKNDMWFGDGQVSYGQGLFIPSDVFSSGPNSYVSWHFTWYNKMLQDLPLFLP